ncbi:MAG TPA: hypothetical protein VHS97_08050 [Isosphaeraceae bacterium]|nr:hypothetical protein [Isosphaeraceae bacterium]
MCTSTPSDADWWSIRRHGPGGVIPAMPIDDAVWSGWLTTNCWHRGTARSVARTPATAYRRYVTAELSEL